LVVSFLGHTSGEAPASRHASRRQEDFFGMKSQTAHIEMRREKHIPRAYQKG